MYTTMAFFALTASVTSGNLSAPTWQNDYRTALTSVASSGKPMAIFIANGSTGWESVVKDGVDAGTKRVLAEKFVCLFVDASTAQGRGVAEAFEVSRGLVISDRTGTVQAYSLAGEITKAELAKTLNTYADAPTAAATETVLRGGELVYGGKCSTGTCSTGTSFAGTCATGTCGAPVTYYTQAPAAPVAPGTVVPAPAAPAAGTVLQSAPVAQPCPTSNCNAAPTTCGSSRKCGFGGFRSKCGSPMPSCGTSHAAPVYQAAPCASNTGFGGFNKCGFGGGMKSCGSFGGGCSTGGCK